ncbi:hypothetical protein ILUMI_08896 [Ignelater luminosus]|uniref:Fibrinogen C-terminal domain-containing protein n=1 Tax=Ignelater luminosus TaxID=2038154 RepID=A0A8K0DAE2_IGNLU|nr:hypothetical protein ILUMI_08896 [Ignelater luminosus]
MILLYHSIIYLFCLKLCFCVPPTTVSIVSTTTEHQKVWDETNDEEDLKEIKFAVKTLAEHFGKWSYVYLSQTEPKLTSSLTTLANIDSNIKNLQERAHVWDTFQLHVAAWNDQLSTSDRKLDIISKAQEEILSLERKVNEFSNFEYKIDKILKRLEVFEESLDVINKKLEHTGQFRDSLFGEFATRGILSTLKAIERKLDRILSAKQNANGKASLIKKSTEETKGKLTIKCNTPPIVEELLQDVASKVDVIFDKMNTEDNSSNEEEFDNEDYMDDQNYLNEDISNSNPNGDLRLINKVWKRINHPWKQVRRLLGQLDKGILAVYNNTAVILENGEVLYEKHGNCLSTDIKSYLNNLVSDIKLFHNDINKTLNEQMTVLENNFNDHKLVHNKILTAINENNRKCVKGDYNLNSNEESLEHDSFIPKLPFNFLRYYTDKSSCDELEYGKNSGVYNLLVHPAHSNAVDYTYYTRYCEIREDASWTVIQNRDNYENIHNFSLDWHNYKIGFGQLNSDFWFGNDFIHKLSYEQNLILRIELEDFDENTAWAEYNQFKVGPESENYRLTIGEYQGNATDSFSSHNNSLFSTFDVKNDDAPDCCPCAESYGGGWWFNSCFEANLNGVYYRDPHGKEQFRGIIWEHWLGDYSLKKTKMMVRRKGAIYEDDVTTTTDVHRFLEDP